MKTLFSFSLFFICGCVSKPEKLKPQPIQIVPWQQLTIQLQDTIIKLDHSLDIVEVNTGNGGVETFKISKAGKDSLFNEANQLIDFKGHPKWFCTDYVATLKVRVRYTSQLAKEVSFSSLCNWRYLNYNTNRIDQLLKNITYTSFFIP